MSIPQHQTSDDTPATGPTLAASSTPDNSFPWQWQDHECFVKVSFDFPTSTRPPWQKLGFLIPLAADVYELSQGVKKACDRAITLNRNDLSDLHAVGKDIKGLARIFMPDGSDIFANRTASGRVRIESVSDLFTNAERREGYCVVSVRVVLSVIERPLQLITLPTGPPSVQTVGTKAFKFLRDPTLTSDTTHRDMESAILQTPPGTVHTSGASMPGVFARRINALWIGSVDHVNGDEEMKNLDTSLTPPWIIQLPELPPLTFNDYSIASNAGISNILKQSGSRIELAVRLVDRLSGPYSGLMPEDLRLPGNVVVSVKHGEKQKSLICKALEEALRNFGARPENKKTLASTLFHENFKPEWEFQLWILPQAARPKKLFRFNGGLVNFLDTAMVSGGNLRMYVEAHIVPKREEQREQVGTTAEEELSPSIASTETLAEEDLSSEEEITAERRRRIERCAEEIREFSRGVPEEDRDTKDFLQAMADRLWEGFNRDDE
ncbi:hypothetical protein CBER1_05078 [Cercospora berteroae]|uniref:Uncharacterized protein n=1 Tax=Cercospora berteroae TaxID=357750 RepID=A0A2S6BRF3_9PEZI|nr:hypothetical protein CBER1_05078 [Cercospora berteroae]